MNHRIIYTFIGIVCIILLLWIFPLYENAQITMNVSLANSLFVVQTMIFVLLGVLLEGGRARKIVTEKSWNVNRRLLTLIIMLIILLLIPPYYWALLGGSIYNVNNPLIYPELRVFFSILAGVLLVRALDKNQY